jgi:hypothetical protein
VHFHIVLRADGPEEPFNSPPSFLSTTLLTHVISSVVKEFSLATTHGRVQWGQQHRVADASALDRDDLRIAAYVAKYATKTTDSSLDFARRFHSRDEILKARRRSSSPATSAHHLGSGARAISHVNEPATSRPRLRRTRTIDYKVSPLLHSFSGSSRR